MACKKYIIFDTVSQELAIDTDGIDVSQRLRTRSRLSAPRVRDGIAPFSGTYKADQTTSKFPVIFTTGSTMVSFFDLTVSFGMSTPAEHTVNNTLGNPVFNVDLLAMKRSSTGPGKFTVDVPISSSDLYNGDGAYVLTAAVLRAAGNQNAYLFRADQFTVVFDATTS